ncbi:hypothetical protein ACFL2H_06055 [Planctomycetota bacterium]
MKAETMVRLANWMLRLAIGLSVILAFVCLSFMTVGTDEAWVLMGVRSLYSPFEAGVTSSPILTSSGLYTIVESLLFQLSTDTIWVHRIFPLACWFAICTLLFRHEKANDSDFDNCLIPMAVMIGAPGTLIVASSALGTVPAFFLFLLASMYWFRTGHKPRIKVLVSGCLFGLAAATRTDLILFAPAIIIASLTCPDVTKRISRFTEAVSATILGMLVFVLNGIIHEYLKSPEEHEIDLGATTGIAGALFDYPQILNKFIISNSFLPFSVMVVITCLAFYKRSQKKDFEWQYFLICFGFISWAAWIVRAPIPHLRYLWPGQAAFAVVLGINLSRLSWQNRSNRFLRLACVCISLGMVVDGLGCTFRHVVCGNSDIVSWEWSREIDLNYFRRFQHLEDEHELKKYLVESAIPGEIFAVTGPPYRYRYLTGLPCFDYKRFPADLLQEQGKQYRFVLGPEVGNYFYFHPKAFAFFRDDCELEKEVGDFSIYRVTDVDRLNSMPAFLRTNYSSHPGSATRFGVHLDR